MSREYDKGIALLALGIAPGLLAPKALAARTRIQSILMPFYVEEQYNRPDVGALVRNRANLMRRLGHPANELSTFEFIMAWASVTNSVPALFWLFANVVSYPERAARIREEVVATAGEAETEGTVTLSVAKLRKECPLLVACYQETLRFCGDGVGNRRVMKDTLLKDPADGREYLLTEGTNVQWASQVVHLDEKVWGANAEAFDPAKWVSMSPQDGRVRKSMIPFGGGKNLCPGRYFAEAELLGFLSGLLLVFEVDGVQVPQPADPELGGSIKQPDWGDVDKSFTIVRRKGWEGVDIQFEI